MNATTALVLLITGAYLIGAIPFGLLIGLTQGIDVRTAGSRNIGASNVGRLLGRRFGVLVFVLDVLKGLVPTALAGWALVELGGQAGPPEQLRYLCWLTIGVVCILGHNYPIYLAFNGGKGVATSLGVALGVYPHLTIPALAAFVIWAVVVAVSRYISLGSIAAGIAFPILFLAAASYRGLSVTADGWPLLVFSLLMSLLVVVRHLGNIRRLAAGTEPKLGGGQVQQAS
jgi:glycerol-3-phosphate acyltransferase PlsY